MPLNSPRYLMSLFVATIVLPAAALAVLAWRTLDQDRELERQHIRDRLDGVANTVAAGLDSRLKTMSRLLAELPQSSLADYPPDTVLLSIGDSGISAIPPGRLLYYPAAPPAVLPLSEALSAAEGLEFRGQDSGAAVKAYRELTRSQDVAVSASAWLGLARTLLRGGKVQEALEAYNQLARIQTIMPGDEPAELVARYAACKVLAERNDPILKARAAALYRDLQTGRWQLDRSSYQVYANKVGEWLPHGEAANPGPVALSLADAADKVLEIRVRLRQQPDHGFTAVSIQENPVLIAWENTPARLIALEAGAGYFHFWSDLWKNQNVKVLFTDLDGHPVLGEPPVSGSSNVVRSAAETGLPWNMQIGSADPKNEGRLAAGRRKVVIGGLAIVGVLIIAGGCLVSRARAGERTVARMQKDFVAAVSHEFRSPLTSMRHLLEMLDQGAVDSEERRRQFYGVLVRETMRLHRLVENLLNFGRLEDGRAEYQFEILRAADLVESVATDFRSELAARDRLIMEIHAPEARVAADREALGRALWNLLDNAAKYSPESAPIRLELRADREKLRISVHDLGPGIPVEERKAVFEKFYRGAHARASGVKGTGIGLATVQHIASAHGGTVELKSEPGEGSIFTLVLPLCDP